MGYTVYWYYKKKPTSSQRTSIVSYIKSLLAKYPQVIKIEFPEAVNSQEINFNGIGELEHETFTFYKSDTKDDGFTFCKTARKPYDHQVKLALMYMKKVLGNGIEISCDGENEETDPAGWKDVLKKGD
jgi:hypothetical protein